jgi:hypothetical protein
MDMADPNADTTGTEKCDNSSPPEPIGAIINAAIAKLKLGSEEADAEKALSILKAAFEIEKMRAEAGKAQADTTKVGLDATLARKQMRVALLGSMFTPLVPLASLLTVVVTIFVAREQTRSADQLAAQKSEETSWSTFQDDIDKSTPDKLLSTATFVSKLRRFASAGKYSKEISDIEFQLMSGATSDAAFKQLWKLRFTGTDDNNITQVIELARVKKLQFDHVTVDCKQIKAAAGALPEDRTWTYLGTCSPKYSIDDLSKAIPDPATLKSAITLKASVQDLTSISYFLSNEIGKYITAFSNKKSGPKQLDISGIVLSGADFDDVDFSLMNLTQTVFFSSRFRGAIILSTAPTYDFRGSNWWDADKIDQTFLPYLISYLYPNQPNVIYPSGYQITNEQYANNVAKLCTSQLKICSAACLRFASEAPPTAPECQAPR